MANDKVVEYKVDPGRVLQKALEQALEEVRDLTIPLTLITKDWFRSNRAIFSLKGPGKYVDLSERYKLRKQKDVGFVYPILKRKGLLEQSMTEAGNSDSINLIIDGQSLILGTKRPYAHFHQEGTKYLPIRPVIFTDGEQSATDDMYNRSGAWRKILMDYILQVSKKVSKVQE